MHRLLFLLIGWIQWRGSSQILLPIVLDSTAPGSNTDMCFHVGFWPVSTTQASACRLTMSCSDGTTRTVNNPFASCTAAAGGSSCEVCVAACPTATTALLQFVCDWNAWNVTNQQYIFPTAGCITPQLTVTSSTSTSQVTLHWNTLDVTSLATSQQWLISDRASENVLQTVQMTSRVYTDLIAWNTTTANLFHYTVLDAGYVSCPRYSFIVQRPGVPQQPDAPSAADYYRQFYTVSSWLGIGYLASLAVLLVCIGIGWTMIEQANSARKHGLLACLALVYILAAVNTPRRVFFITVLAGVLGFFIGRAIYTAALLLCCPSRYRFPIKSQAEGERHLLQMYTLALAFATARFFNLF
jgi:hypothetical protein